jgi:flagellar protein FliS
MNPNELARYGAVKITTGSPAQILVMLYDGMFRFLRESMVATEAGNYARSGERAGRALKVLDHLLQGLDRAALPSLCDKLEPLYVFCMRHIVQANARHDCEAMAEVIRILTPLRDAWAVAEKQVATDAGRAAAEMRKTG